MTQIGIIDYQAGNIRSIESAFEALGASVTLVTSADQISSCTHLVLPGVGAFGFCMDRLRQSALIPALEDWTLTQKRPMLGICVGMQLMADTGYERGVHRGLGWIGGEVRPLRPDPPTIRVPHVGWNNVEFLEDFGKFQTNEAPDMYFDHSYAYFDPVHGHMVAACMHGVSFAVVVRRANLVAAQFHPEKSQDAGLKFLDSFLKLPATC